MCFRWPVFVENKDIICLFCLCMGFAALYVAKELAGPLWVRSRTSYHLECFLFWIEKMLLIVKEKIGIRQSGDKPRLNMVAAACSSGRCWPHSWEKGCFTPTPNSLWLKWTMKLGFWDHGVNICLSKCPFIFTVLLICIPLVGCTHWDFLCYRLGILYFSVCVQITVSQCLISLASFFHVPLICFPYSRRSDAQTCTQYCTWGLVSAW